MQTTIRNILLGALLTIGLGVPYLQAADVAISALPSGSALAGNEYIPAVQSGATVKVQPAAIATYLLSGSATTEVLANNAGAFDGDSGFTFNATNNTVDLGGATLTASDPVLDLSQTWNSGAVTFEGLKLNVTDTASAAASRLLDLQVGGVSNFAAGKNFDIFLRGASGIRLNAASASTLDVYGNGTTSMMRLNTSRASFLAEIGLGSSPGSPDVILSRGAASVLQQRNSTSAQTLQVFDTYTDSSNYGRLALNTSLTGDWVQVAAETAGTGGDNYGIALTPTGTGAISAHVPDSTVAGGNARGAYAVDWQNVRSAAVQVSSGQGGVISGGYANTASSTYSTVSGGSTNIASATYATVSGGLSNSASGVSSWVPGGSDGFTRGLYGAAAYSAGKRSAQGDAQVILQPVRRTTTDATPVSLATDGTPAATTVMVLPSDSTATCQAIVTANTTTAGVVSMAGFRAEAIVKNDSSTMTISGGTCTAIGTADAALTTATCALVANGTLDSIELQVTGVAATTVYWVAEVKCVQAL